MDSTNLVQKILADSTKSVQDLQVDIIKPDLTYLHVESISTGMQVLDLLVDSAKVIEEIQALQEIQADQSEARKSGTCNHKSWTALAGLD